MSYLSLYRKYRPRTFSDVTGQDHITQTLKRQLESGKLAHAYVFSGTRGTGKTTCAKILAKAVNCEHPVNGDPCNECPTCVGIDSGAILDVTEMDAASNNGIDDVRALQEEAFYVPASAAKRVYIIDEVHMLSKAAFNALLKTLEEPQEHLLFILATTELNKVPATILSRCQRFVFKRIPRELIAARLRYVAECENLPLTVDGAEVLARLADGALRDALSLLERCQNAERIDRATVLDLLGLAEGEQIAQLYRFAASGDAQNAVALLNVFYSNGKDVGSVLEQLAAYVRDSMLVTMSNSAESLLSGAFDYSELTPGDVPLLIVHSEQLQTALSALDRSPDRKLAAELALIRLGTRAIPQMQIMQSPVAPVAQVAAAPTVRAAVPPPQVSASAPITQAPSGDAKPPFTWKALLDEIALNPLLMRSLKSGKDVIPSIGADSVVLQVADPFIEGQFTPDTLSQIADAATRLNNGASMRVIVTTGAAAPSASVAPSAPAVAEVKPPTDAPFPLEETSSNAALDNLMERFSGSNVIQFTED